MSLVLSVALVTACNIKDDTPRFNQLDRLRVLGVRAEPADLVVGESATLSALVYAPGDPDIHYEWSWCPARSGPEEAFTCAIAEPQLIEIWDALEPGFDLPPYDLGTGETAQVWHVFPEEVAFGICEALMADEGSDRGAVLSCLKGLELSVRLRVVAGDDAVVAIKTVRLQVGKPEPGERNHNPDPSGELQVRRSGDLAEVKPDAPLLFDQTYDLRAGFEPEQAEHFTPDKTRGGTPPEPRRETLIMTWFVTMGTTTMEGDGPKFGEGGRTSFVDGSMQFQDVLENAWQLPFEDPRDEARLYLVLRDERGGMGWVEHRFDVQEAP